MSDVKILPIFLLKRLGLIYQYCSKYLQNFKAVFEKSLFFIITVIIIATIAIIAIFIIRLSCNAYSYYFLDNIVVNYFYHSYNYFDIHRSYWIFIRRTFFDVGGHLVFYNYFNNYYIFFNSVKICFGDQNTNLFLAFLDAPWEAT